MNTSEFEPNEPQQRSVTSSSGDDRSNNNTNNSSNMLAMTATKTNNNTSPSAAATAATTINKDHRDGSMDEDMDSGSSPNSLSNETGGDRGPGSTDSSPIDSHSSSGSNKNSASNSHHHSHLGSSASNSSASPVRRLPSVLRPPTSSIHNNVNGNVAGSVGLAASNARNPQFAGAASGGHLLGQQRQQMYGSGGGDGTPTSGSSYGAATTAPMSMRSFYANAMDGGSNADAQSRSYGHERIHMQPQSAGESPSALGSGGLSSANMVHSSPQEDMDSDSSPRGQKRRLDQFDPRAYSRDHHQQHRSSPSSTSGPSNNNGSNSNGANVLVAAAAISRQQHHNHLQQLQYQQPTILHEDDDDDESSSVTHFGDSSRGSHGPRDEMRYETWTSKQLRKKCSHLKLRGLKNVKKHVMVEALYRYYRNQRQKELIGGSMGSSANNVAAGGSAKASSPSSLNNDQQQQQSGYNSSRNSGGGGSARYDHHSSSSAAGGGYSSSNNATMGRSRTGGGSNQSDRTHAVSSSSSGSSQPTLNNVGSSSSLSRKQQQQLAQVHASTAKSPPSATVVRHRAVSYNDEVDMDDHRSEMRRDHLDNEIHVTSEDVIRLVDVVLSPVFVDRLAVELSRWQFWVDVREKYIAMLKTTPASNYGSTRAHAGGSSSMSDHHDMLNRSSHMSMISSRNFKWSSMQLWEIWKELTFAYTKTCFEFTAAGSDERDYINFCEGRPDVYYLHQRLHARPDLLHLIKSNEYIEEKATSDASESIAHDNNTMPLVGNNAVVGNVAGSASPSMRGHKRFKRIVPAPSHQVSSSSYGQVTASSASGGNGGASSSSGAGNNTTSGSGGSSTVASQNLAGTTRRSGARDFLANSSESSPNAQEDGNGNGGGSTENSETTGEEGSEGKKSNASSERQQREVLAEQKYFGLLLQNFEAIFESLHNKKVLLAALRKDPNAPDHLIADLHDDIHVLSALKKEFRNKLRNTLE